jgi:hypothetical protein
LRLRGFNRKGKDNKKSSPNAIPFEGRGTSNNGTGAGYGDLKNMKYVLSCPEYQKLHADISRQVDAVVIGSLRNLKTFNHQHGF